ncbi:unnamed protein product [Withania somnifera]
MNHQEWNTQLVDVSSYLLFESTGDSEFDSNFCSTSDDAMDSLTTINPCHRLFLEDDDAQSCSYEERIVHVVDDDMDLDFKIENDGVVDSSRCQSVGWNSNRKEDEEEEEDEAGVVEQHWMNGVNRCNKSKYVTSVVDTEFKSQKDKDKLFWETCLAS